MVSKEILLSLYFEGVGVTAKEERLFSVNGIKGPINEVFRLSSDRKRVMIFPVTLSSAQAYGLCKRVVTFFEEEGKAFDAQEREVIIDGQL